jgi:hypothetical protein
VPEKRRAKALGGAAKEKNVELIKKGQKFAGETAKVNTLNVHEGESIWIETPHGTIRVFVGRINQINILGPIGIPVAIEKQRGIKIVPWASAFREGTKTSEAK